MYLNPGFAGIDGVSRVTGIFRKQWVGYTTTDGNTGYGAPTSAVITLSTPTPFLKKKLGFCFSQTKTTATFNICGVAHFIFSYLLNK